MTTPESFQHLEKMILDGIPFARIRPVLQAILEQVEAETALAKLYPEINEKNTGLTNANQKLITDNEALVKENEALVKENADLKKELGRPPISERDFLKK